MFYLMGVFCFIFLAVIILYFINNATSYGIRLICGLLIYSAFPVQAQTIVPGEGRVVLAESTWVTPVPTTSLTLGPRYLPMWLNIVGESSYNPPSSSSFSWSSDSKAYGYKVSEDVILGITGVVAMNYSDILEGPLLQAIVTYNHNGSTESITPSGWDFYSKWSIRRSESTFQPPSDNVSTFTGSVWLYVGPNATFNPSLTIPGVYLGRRMSSSTTGYAGLWLTQSTSLSIVPPACTMSTKTSVTFDTTTGETAIKQQAPLTVTCENSNSGRDFQLQLKSQPVAPSVLQSKNVITLQNSADNTQGGWVRGFVGASANDDAGCQDKSTSIPFDGSALGFATLQSNTAGSGPVPLIWVLCKSGTEKPGLATGAAMLELFFK